MFNNYSTKKTVVFDDPGRMGGKARDKGYKIIKQIPAFDSLLCACVCACVGGSWVGCR